MVNYQFSSSVSFQIHQSAIKPDSEEEEESIEVFVTIRGSLFSSCDFLFESCNEHSILQFLLPKCSVKYDNSKGKIFLVGAPNEQYRIVNSKEIIRYTPHPIIYRTDGSILQFNLNEWQLIDSNGKGFFLKDGKWFKQPLYDISSEYISSYFCSRSVSNRSDGFRYFEDGDESMFVFPDKTTYKIKTQTWTHPLYPAVIVSKDGLSVETSEFSAKFTNDNNIKVEAKNQEYACDYFNDTRHFFVHFGKLGVANTLIDLVTGYVANLGTRKNVYYLNEDFQWVIGKQNCSKKDIIQHFRNGNMPEKLVPITEFSQEEIESIFSTGHRPRLFVIERTTGDVRVNELWSHDGFRQLLEDASSQITKSTGNEIVLWFDTNPKSYREFVIHPKIKENLEQRIPNLLDQQLKYEEQRKKRVESLNDPKWKEIEEKQLQEESEVKSLLEKEYALLISDFK